MKALTEQANKVWHTSNLFRIQGRERLPAERWLPPASPIRCSSGNSGAEALECGFKLLRKYRRFRRRRPLPGDRFEDFHGRTLRPWPPPGMKYLKGYAPYVGGFDHVPFGIPNGCAQDRPETAAILIEPVQGEGGMRAGSVEFLKGLRQTCDEFGIA